MAIIWKPDERTRKFLREVGIIILGVLVALGIGEVADRVRWRFDVAEAHAAMISDLARDAGVTHERTLVSPCIERRIRQVSALLRTARRTGRLPDISDIGRTPTRPLPRAAWDTAIGTGILSHMDRGQSAEWSGWFDLVTFYAVSSDNERRLWSRLSAMSGSAGPISETLLSELVLTVADLRSSSALTTASGQQIEQRALEMGAAPDYWIILDRQGGTEAEVKALLPTRTMCRPLIVDGKAFDPPSAAS